MRKPVMKLGDARGERARQKGEDVCLALRQSAFRQRAEIDPDAMRRAMD